jgi:hypothetical protein
MKLIQEEHDARKMSWGGDRKSSGEILHLKNDDTKANKIRPEIAREHGIIERLVKTAVEVGRGIDKAAEVLKEAATTRQDRHWQNQYHYHVPLFHQLHD